MSAVASAVASSAARSAGGAAVDATTSVERSGNWVAVASAEHGGLGRAQGFMQVCHGKAAPLRRLHGGDRIAYYSPTNEFRGPGKLQAFTAIGAVRDAAPYQADMGGGFCPYRRDVHWWRFAQAAPIQPLLDRLEFAGAGGRNWGYQLRFGLFAISVHDMDLIVAAMGARVR